MRCFIFGDGEDNLHIVYELEWKPFNVGDVECFVNRIDENDDLMASIFDKMLQFTGV